MTFLTDTMFFNLARKARQHGGSGQRMLAFYALFLVANICVAFQPVILARIINSIQAGGGGAAVTRALQWAAVYGGLTIFFWLLHGPARVMERHFAFSVFRAYVASLYRKVTEMPLRWHQDHHSGDTINRINKAGYALSNFAQEQFIVIQMTVRFCVSMILLGLYSPWVLAVSLTVSFILALAIRHFDRVLVALLVAVNEREHKLNALLFDYISNIVTILTLRVQDNTRDEVDHHVMAVKPARCKEIALNEWKWASVNIVLVVTQAGIVGTYIALHLWRHEPLAIGNVVAIFQYLLIISQVFYDAAQVYGRLMQRSLDLRGVDGLEADHARIGRTSLLQSNTVWRTLRLQGLTFTHHEGEDVLHHLAGVDLAIPAGKKIALMGASGSGKTTLLTLLRGLYVAQSVSLMVDDQVFDSLAPLAAFTTLVPQDSEIFENTVLYNLTLGTDVPDEIVRQALSISAFEDVVPKLPQGLETDIRERGVNLSGGQKQRLALARGLIAARASSLLLLDEPTSSVDLATESAIFEKLFTGFAGKAIIASVHRLHLLPRFDFICLMRDGAMVEQGTFSALLALRGEFHTIWQHHLQQSAAGDIASGI